MTMHDIARGVALFAETAAMYAETAAMYARENTYKVWHLALSYPPCACTVLPGLVPCLIQHVACL